MITAVSGIKAPAFKGNVEGETTEKKPTFEEQVDSFTKKVDTVSENAQGTVNSVVGATATISGGVGMVKKAVTDNLDEGSKGFFRRLYNNFRPAVGKEEIKDATGEVIDTVIKRKTNWKNVGFLAAGILILGAGLAIIKGIKNKKAEKANEEAIMKAKEMDELKHQQELREIEQAKEIAAAQAAADAE